MSSFPLRAKATKRHSLAALRTGLVHLVPVVMILMTAVSTSAQSSNISVSVADGRDTVRAGGELIYNITLRTTDGSSQTADVKMRLPQFVNFMSASNGGSLVGAEVIWDDVAVSGSSSRSLTVNVQVHTGAPTDHILTAEVVVNGVARATDTTRVTDSNAVPSTLLVTITDGKDTIASKDAVQYSIRVKNVGTQDRTYTLRVNLPEVVSFLSASDGYLRRNGSIDWINDILQPGQSADYTISGVIDDDAAGFYAIRVSANTGGVNERASDTTIVHQGPVPADFNVGVSADRESALPGDEVTYNITLTNRSNALATHVNLTNALPPYVEFVSASEGGTFTGANEVRFDDMTVSPGGKRLFHVTGRLRKDTPLGITLINSVFVAGHRATALVQVEEGGVASRPTPQSNSVLLRKTADRSEVRPGDTISYTILLRNTTGKVLNNLTVKDRLDERYMTLKDGADDAVHANGEMIWEIDRLEVGESWQRHYTVTIAKNVPQGVSLNNVVSVGGADIASLSLTERVVAANLPVFTGMPPTGAGMDAIFVGLTSLLGAGQLFFQRRRIL